MTASLLPTGAAVRSQYLHVIRLRSGAFLCLNAVTRRRAVVERAIVDLLAEFAEPRPLRRWVREQGAASAAEREAHERVLLTLLELSFLVRGSHRTERRRTQHWLSGHFDRDPDAGVANWVRETHHDQYDYWAVQAPLSLAAAAHGGRAVSLLVIGTCDVQMELSFLVDEGRRHGLAIKATTAFEHDVALAGERSFDFIIIGGLRAKIAVLAAGGSPAPYLDQLRELLTELRARSAARILINNLPVPTVSPLGFADRSAASHVDRVRRLNLDIVGLARSFADVYVVDVDAAFALVGKRGLLDDQTMAFDHLGSLRWLAARPEGEKATVHHVFPPLDLLAAFGPGAIHDHERVLATEHLRWIVALTGDARRKCVVVDLDNTLWPGVLADTGSPFGAMLAGPYSFGGLYFGLHEALKALKQRGILLAIASKNDEATVRELWRYQSELPVARLLSWDDFVTVRINWDEKVDSLRSIAAELNLGLDALAFLDDNPVERDKVRRFLPEVMVLGDNPFLWRGELLQSAAFQVIQLSDEARDRTALTRAQVQREQLRLSSHDVRAFLAELDIRIEIEQLELDMSLDRAVELIGRTNQFNTSSVRLTRSELIAILRRGGGIFVARVIDRFADYGQVAVLVVDAQRIPLFAVSCRVLGLGIEHGFLHGVLDRQRGTIRADLHTTERNLAARNIYRDNGFTEESPGVWRIDLAGRRTQPAPAHYRVDWRTASAGPSPAVNQASR